MRLRRAALLGLVLWATSCSSGSTQVQLEIAAGTPLPLTSLTATFTLSGAVSRQKTLTLGSTSLPTTVAVVLPDVAATLDVVVSATDEQGSVWSGSGSYTTVVHRTLVETLTLIPGALVGDGGEGADLPDGANPHVWKQVASSGPSPRNSARMVWDSGRKVMVLFGGVTTSGDVNDTWEWDGATWTKRTPAHSPTPRHSVAMAYDEMHGATFLFSGAVMGGGPTTDGKMWKWNGTDWTSITTNTPPAPRTASMMVYDSTRHVSVLFGGELAGNMENAETWEFDGANWNKPTLQGGTPPSRHAYSMVYDAAHQRVVLYGGAGPVSTTWTYDGTAWTDRGLQASPPARRAAAMAYDSVRGVIVLFGGNRNATSPGRATVGDTWEWDGVSTSWDEKATTGPPARSSAAMAFDPVRGEVLLFGGNISGASGGPPANPLGDTWSR